MSAEKIPAGGGAWLAIGLSCSLLAAVVATIVGMYALPEFTAAYASSGTKLPFVTRLFVRGYRYMWLVPLIVLCAWRFWPDAGRRHKIAGTIGLGALLIFMPFMIFALYLAIFGLAGTL